MRLRKRAGGLLLGAGILFLIGTNVQAGWLFVLAAFLLGAVVTGVLLPFASLRGLEAGLTAPAEASQGEDALVEVRLHNRRRGVRWSVVAADAHLEPVEVFTPSVRHGERVELSTLRVPLRRGDQTTSEVQVRTAAPFGVAERRRRLPVEPVRTLVLPRVLPLGPLPFVEPATTQDAGIHSAPRRGVGPDYLGVREYRTGDSMRHVHWGLTARHGQVMVREFEEERTRRLAIVVDTERDAATSWTPLDRCCAVAASISGSARAQGQGVRLVGATDPLRVEMVGRADPHDLLRWLARLVPSGMPLPDALARLSPADLRGLETVVVAFPVWADRDAGSLASALAGLPVRRVVAVPVALADGEGRAGDVVELARTLERAGIDVRPWRPDEDLSIALLGERVEAGT